jgi:hypothetical protein
LSRPSCQSKAGTPSGSWDRPESPCVASARHGSRDERRAAPTPAVRCHVGRDEAAPGRWQRPDR